jgi:hypothetical protein
VIATSPAPIDAAWYDAAVRHSTHAIERFVERAQPPAGFQAADLLRDLAVAQGCLVAERPRWAGSRRTADAYLQIAEFLLLLLERDRLRPGGFTCVTVLNGAEWKTWQVAYDRGWVAVAPPAPRPAVWTPQQLGEIRARAWRDAQASVADEREPEIRGRWLSSARKQARAARAAFRADQRRRVEATFARTMGTVGQQHARQREALARWEHIDWPAYRQQLQRAWAANQ